MFGFGKKKPADPVHPQSRVVESAIEAFKTRPAKDTWDAMVDAFVVAVRQDMPVWAPMVMMDEEELKTVSLPDGMTECARFANVTMDGKVYHAFYTSAAEYAKKAPPGSQAGTMPIGAFFEMVDDADTGLIVNSSDGADVGMDYTLMNSILARGKSSDQDLVWNHCMDSNGEPIAYRHDGGEGEMTYGELSNFVTKTLAMGFKADGLHGDIHYNTTDGVTPDLTVEMPDGGLFHVMANIKAYPARACVDFRDARLEEFARNARKAHAIPLVANVSVYCFEGEGSKMIRGGSFAINVQLERR